MKEKYMGLKYGPQKTKRKFETNLAYARKNLGNIISLVDEGSVYGLGKEFKKVENDLNNLGMLFDYVKYLGQSKKKGISSIFLKSRASKFKGFDEWDYLVEASRIYGESERLNNYATRIRNVQKEELEKEFVKQAMENIAEAGKRKLEEVAA